MLDGVDSRIRIIGQSRAAVSRTHGACRVWSWHESQAILAPVYVTWHAPQAATLGSSATAAADGVAIWK